MCTELQINTPSFEHQMAAELSGVVMKVKETKRSKENKKPKQKVADQTVTK